MTFTTVYTAALCLLIEYILQLYVILQQYDFHYSIYCSCMSYYSSMTFNRVYTRVVYHTIAVWPSLQYILQLYVILQQYDFHYSIYCSCMSYYSSMTSNKVYTAAVCHTTAVWLSSKSRTLCKQYKLYRYNKTLQQNDTRCWKLTCKRSSIATMVWLSQKQHDCYNTAYEALSVWSLLNIPATC